MSTETASHKVQLIVKVSKYFSNLNHMSNPKICKHCKKPLPLSYDELCEKEEIGECSCPSSYYANQSDADRAADAEYLEYIKSDETDKIQY